MHRVSAAVLITGLLVAGCGGTTTKDAASTAASTAADTTAASTTVSAAPPLTEAALDGLLLTPADIEAITGVTGMTVAATSNALATDLQVAADAPPERIACVGIAGTAEAQAYAGAGSTAVRDQLLTAPGEKGASRTAAQSAILFDSAEKAAAFVTGSAERWSTCKEFKGAGSATTVDPVATTDGVVSTTMTTTDSNGAKVACQRALTAANNVVVEASACSAAAPDAAVAMARRIAEKVTDQ